jgi:hypothetical protein
MNFFCDSLGDADCDRQDGARRFRGPFSLCCLIVPDSRSDFLVRIAPLCRYLAIPRHLDVVERAGVQAFYDMEPPV